MAFSDYTITFFAGSDEPPESRARPQNAAMTTSRDHQDIIAGKLTRLASNEYLEDIIGHIYHMEVATLPDVSLIDKQPEIQWFMRPYLIDFLIEVHAFFALLPQTLFRTVNLLDRYCSKSVIYKKYYQLLGCVSLLIAAKYGDAKDRVPRIHQLSNICNGLYDPEMFIQMETHVLNTVEWTIGSPTVDFFSRMRLMDGEDSQEVQHLTAYLCELALYHPEFVSTKPSTMARASVTLARAVVGQFQVQDTDVADTVNLTRLNLSSRLHQSSRTLQRKYSIQELPCVSTKLAHFVYELSAITHQIVEPPTLSVLSSSPKAEHFTDMTRDHL